MSALLWTRIQQSLGIATDGIPGPRTAQAVAEKLGIAAAATPAPVQSNGISDSRSEANISTLRKDTQIKAREWLAACRTEGINVKIITGTRTYQEQDALYAQGRSKAGARVTNAPGGYSWHNFGVGWDFVVFDAIGQPQWESPLMETCGQIAESLGLEWGGHWTGFQDTPHIQLKPGCTLTSLPVSCDADE